MSMGKRKSQRRGLQFVRNSTGDRILTLLSAHFYHFGCPTSQQGPTNSDKNTAIHTASFRGHLYTRQRGNPSMQFRFHIPSTSLSPAAQPFLSHLPNVEHLLGNDVGRRSFHAPFIYQQQAASPPSVTAVLSTRILLSREVRLRTMEGGLPAAQQNYDFSGGRRRGRSKSFRVVVSLQKRSGRKRRSSLRCRQPDSGRLSSHQNRSQGGWVCGLEDGGRGAGD